MIGSRRNDSSTIRATPSASGEARSRRNFSINSSARSGEVPLARQAAGTGVSSGRIRDDTGALVDPWLSRRLSRGTPRARQILLKVPAWGLLVLPRSI